MRLLVCATARSNLRGPGSSARYSGASARRVLILPATLLFALGGCSRSATAAASGGALPAMTQPASEAELAVRRYVGAFNRHDVEAMMAQVDPDIRWHSIVGDSIRTETSGRAALERELISYFRSLPTVQSTLGPLSSNGPYVAGRETVQWERSGVRKTQASLSVYEIRDGRVRRVWYYPAVTDTP